MASIKLFPLSINGINSPLNLIDQALAPTNYNNNLLYPIDLASNPQYCHAIQFTIYDYSYPKLTEAYGQIVNAVNVTGTAVSNAVTSATQRAEDLKNKLSNQPISQTASQSLSGIQGSITSASNAIKNFTPQSLTNTINAGIDTGGKIGGTLNNTNLKPQITGDIRSTISLYLPDTLTTSFDSDYTAISLTESFALTGYLSNAFSDQKTRDAFKQAAGGEGLTNLLSNTDVGKSLMSKIIGGGIGGTDIFQQALGVIPNPQLQLLYKGIGLREFQFEFIFTPTSSQEADAVDQIIKAFTYYSLPELSGPQDMFFKPPQIFKINFAYTGDQGAFSQIGQVLNNTLTQALGTQLSGVGGPSAQSKNNLVMNAKNTKLFEIKECVLSNVQLDYAPNGWAAYQDGFPVQTRMTLQFKEMTIQTKADYDSKIRKSPTSLAKTIQNADASALDTLSQQINSKGGIGGFTG